LSACRDAFEVIGHLHEELRHDMRRLEIGDGDVQRWLQLDPWIGRALYVSNDPTLSWVVLQKP